MAVIKYERHNECVHCGKIEVSFCEMDEKEWCEWSDEDPDHVYVEGSHGKERWLVFKAWDCGCVSDEEE